MMTRNKYRSLVASLLGMTAVIPSAARDLHAQDTAFVREQNVAVPMRDGVVLRADVWRPTAPGRYPTLVYRTPYGKHQATAAFSTAAKAVARGYAVVLQDVRGRYASDGEFLPYQQEGKDGYDTIEWAAKQAWSNGSVGTYGLSYPGAVQWLAAIESPPSLKAMAPAMTFQSPNQFWYSNGVWDNSWASWINANIREDRVARLKGDTNFAAIAPWHALWQGRTPEDPFWDFAELRGKYGRTNAAVLNFSGWHDEAYGPHGATGNFAGLVAARGGKTDRVALVMGPWSHGVPRRNRTSAGERQFGPAAGIDYDDIVLNFLDRHMKSVANGVAKQKPVRVFVMGSNRWIDADAWPPREVKPDTIVLRRTGNSTTLAFDPANPVTNEHAPRAGAHDYRKLASDPRVAVFETAPFERDLTVIGAIAAELSISSDAPDAHIWVKVFDVAPDSTAWNLMSSGLDVLSASYRNGNARREPLVPGQIYTVRLGDLITGNTFKAGHRIRVVVSTSFVPDFEPMKQAYRLTVWHSAQHPSRLILPVYPNAAMLSAGQ
jgi:putative CocE/NonD family hydrolase